MDWGKVIYVFFSLMSLTSIAGFLYEHSAVALFVAASLNLVSTFLKMVPQIQRIKFVLATSKSTCVGCTDQ